VDDIIVTGSNIFAVNLIITKLKADFVVKDLGELHFFLGIAALPVSNGLYLTQRKIHSRPSTMQKNGSCKTRQHTG